MRCPLIINFEQLTRKLGQTSEGPHPETYHSVKPIPVPKDREAAREQNRAKPEQKKTERK